MPRSEEDLKCEMASRIAAAFVSNSFLQEKWTAQERSDEQIKSMILDEAISMADAIYGYYQTVIICKD